MLLDTNFSASRISTELWQCHNFACGTNGTLGGVVDGASLDGTKDTDESNNHSQGEKWKQRLWRLPMEHRFIVDQQTMSAPQSKAGKVTATTAASQQSDQDVSASKTTSSPAPKRQKSSLELDTDTKNTTNNNSIADSYESNGILDYLQHQFASVDQMKASNAYRNDDAGGNNADSAPAHIGDVHGKPRLFPLRHMNPPTASGQSPTYFLPISPDHNWPRCPRCNEAARPAVLMFDDLDWVYNLKQETRWQNWCHSLLKLAKQRIRGSSDVSDSDSTTDDVSENGWQTIDQESSDVMLSSSPPKQLTSGDQTAANPLKVLILEIGCGYNVPTCRMITENLVSNLSMRGGGATLVRINPSHPEADDPSIEDNFISLMAKGLVTLKEIDKEYQHLMHSNGDEVDAEEDVML